MPEQIPAPLRGSRGRGLASTCREVAYTMNSTVPQERPEAAVYIYVLYFREDITTCYIGQTNNPDARLQQHLSRSSLKAVNLKNAWIKSRLQADTQLLMEIIEVCPTREEANDREIFWIKSFKASGLNLKNSTRGGEGIIGLEFSFDHRARLGMRMRALRMFRPELWNTPKKRGPRSHRQKAQWAEVLRGSKGKKKTQQTKRRMSEAQKKRWKEAPLDKKAANAERLAGYREGTHPALGAKHSPEAIERRRKSLAKAYHLISPEGISTRIVNMAEFARENGLDKRNLQALVTGRQKTHRGWSLDTERPQGYKPVYDTKIAVEPITDADFKEVWDV